MFGINFDITPSPAFFSAIAATLSAVCALYSAIALKRRHTQDLKEKTVEKVKKEKMKKEKQAREIAVWLSGDTAVLQNVSNMPVYNVLIVAVVVKGSGNTNAEDAMLRNNQESLNPIYPYNVYLQLPPGKYTQDLKLLERDMGRQWGVEILFTDCYENCWKIDSKGVLSEVTDKDYLFNSYQVSNPPNWSELNTN